MAGKGARSVELEIVRGFHLVMDEVVEVREAGIEAGAAMGELLLDGGELIEGAVGSDVLGDIDGEGKLEAILARELETAEVRDGFGVKLGVLRDVLDEEHRGDGELLLIGELDVLLDFGFDAAVRGVDEAGDFEAARRTDADAAGDITAGVGGEILSDHGSGRGGESIFRDGTGDLGGAMIEKSD